MHVSGSIEEGPGNFDLRRMPLRRQLVHGRLEGQELALLGDVQKARRSGQADERGGKPVGGRTGGGPAAEHGGHCGPVNRRES